MLYLTVGNEGVREAEDAGLPAPDDETVLVDALLATVDNSDGDIAFLGRRSKLHLEESVWS